VPPRFAAPAHPAAVCYNLREEGAPMHEMYDSVVHAPDFPAGLDWLNTDGGAPLTLADLRGKLVLLDFWTYG
jgi:hypothetical protein